MMWGFVLAAGGEVESAVTERLVERFPLLVCQRDNFIADCLFRGIVAALQDLPI